MPIDKPISKHLYSYRIISIEHEDSFESNAIDIQIHIYYRQATDTQNIITFTHQTHSISTLILSYRPLSFSYPTNGAAQALSSPHSN